MDTLLLVALAAGAAYAFLGRDRLEQLVAIAHAKLPAVELLAAERSVVRDSAAQGRKQDSRRGAPQRSDYGTG